MKILIMCEYTGIVSSAFKRKGHNVATCDLLESQGPALHFKMDCFKAFDLFQPEMIICHPPCTYLAAAQCHLAYEEKRRAKKSLEAIMFVDRLYNLPCRKIAIENPIGWLNTLWRPPDQIIRPWYFGSKYSKDICLWLKGLPPLISTCYSTKRIPMSNHVNSRMSYEMKRSIKSRFFPEVAEEMSNQWI